MSIPGFSRYTMSLVDGPRWQVVVLSISDAEESAAAELRDRCARAGLRVRVSGAKRGSLDARVRDARLVSYHFIVGAAECPAGDGLEPGLERGLDGVDDPLAETRTRSRYAPIGSPARRVIGELLRIGVLIALYSQSRLTVKFRA